MFAIGRIRLLLYRIFIASSRLDARLGPDAFIGLLAEEVLNRLDIVSLLSPASDRKRALTVTDELARIPLVGKTQPGSAEVQPASELCYA